MGWQDVEIIRDPDGVLAVISKRASGPPVHTIALFKYYDKDGEENRSVFWSVTRQSAAALRVINIAIPRAAQLEAAAFAAVSVKTTEREADHRARHGARR